MTTSNVTSLPNQIHRGTSPARTATSIAVASLLATGFVGAAWAEDAKPALPAADLVVLGDIQHVAMNALAALEEYDLAVEATEGTASPAYGEALEKAARECVALAGGDNGLSSRERATYFRRAEGYARRAVVARPESAEAHFQLALALGTLTLTVGPRDQVQYAILIREEALRALALDPQHSGALHVIGMWNAEVMRLNSVARFVAENLLGGAALEVASWEDAQSYLERAVAIDPHRIAHHLDLALIYADRGMTRDARAQLEWIKRAPLAEYSDPAFKKIAARALATLS